jgi:hypothetical protein
MRYTRKNAEAAFEALAEACGAVVLDYSWPITDERRDGAWTLDHNSTYGGYVISAICPSSPPQDPHDPQTYTAETTPLRDERLSTGEFVRSCWTAVRAIHVARENASVPA